MASISANRDEEIGSIIAAAMETVGNAGTTIVDEATGIEYNLGVVEGLMLVKCHHPA